MKNWGKFRRSILKDRTPTLTFYHNDRGGGTFKWLYKSCVRFDFGGAIPYEDG